LTYTHNTIGCVLSLGLVKLHLLLMNDCLHLCMFLSDHQEKVFRQDFSSRYLTFVRAAR
jgi:hypothetical protein